MQEVLTDYFVPSYDPVKPEKRAKPRAIDQEPITVDIKLISAAGFHLGARGPNVTIFSLTLEEIDHELQDRKAMEEAAKLMDEELIARKLPQGYQDVVDVFSREDSN